MAPRILFFSIVIGADSSSKLLFMLRWVPEFSAHDKLYLGRVATVTCIFITRQIGSKSIGIRQPAFFAAKVCYLLIFKVSMNLSSQWYISVKKVMNSTVNHWSYLDHPLNMEKQVVMILGDIYLPKW